MLLLKCPKCSHSMKYQSRNAIFFKKRKICVYCGHGFKVTESVVKQIEK